MKHFRLKLISLICSLIGLSISTVFLFQHQYYFSILFVTMLIITVAILLFRIQHKSIEMMKRLTASIQFSDFSISFRTSSNSHLFKELASEMDSTIQNFKQKLYQLEIDRQYYDTLLRTIDSGLLVIDKNGTIQWINQAAKIELGKSALSNISELHDVHPELPTLLSQLSAGEVRVIHLDKKEFSYELMITGISFFIQGKELLLISLKNIYSVLEKNEIEAWQKLIRVLTHEIMNTIAPIISLSETVTDRVSEQGMTEKNVLVAMQAMQTIHRRSKNLLEFVENYRKLTRIPTPTLSIFTVEILFNDLKNLFGRPENIEINYRIDTIGLTLLADRSLIEQILINLIKNAIEARIPDRTLQIDIEAFSQDALTFLSIRDNGTGIAPEAIDKIFVPFYTTKSSGSGIGLSLCRQIMHLHGGSISVSSEEGTGSRFLLRFGLRSHL